MSDVVVTGETVIRVVDGGSDIALVVAADGQVGDVVVAGGSGSTLVVGSEGLTGGLGPAGGIGPAGPAGPDGPPGPAGPAGPALDEISRTFAVPAPDWVIDISSLRGPPVAVIPMDLDGNEIDGLITIRPAEVLISWYYPEAGSVRVLA